MNIRANIEKEVVLKKMERATVQTGFFLEITNGFKAQTETESGLAINKEITILNCPGTIEEDKGISGFEYTGKE